MSSLFFAYGNLKKGFPQHHLMRRANFLGVALTEKKFHLYQVSYFPALFVSSDSMQVFGEIYEVDDFLLLDAVNNVGGQSFFSRQKIFLEEINMCGSPCRSSCWNDVRHSSAETYVCQMPMRDYVSRGDFWSLDHSEGASR